ncbi:AraC family transcriptional regulator [Streptomyces sp. NBC_01460]|uniref:helix-turn-helix transcriptional regulator n=1 Tax=Streptomyces sp. NBC_01460 TaxID=2903875 RepID=UPI002E366F8B|nr:AraC family transcriptional regulator [Streptomyces sp. NBC_01460]
MVFVLALRTALERLTELSPALQALRHPGISASLVAIYRDYARPWTVETLAREAGMSRSVFSETFRALVGDTPAHHLTVRRLQQARALLSDGSVALSDIPARVGYHSNVGFHLAFRREFDTTPGAYRQALRPARSPRPRTKGNGLSRVRAGARAPLRRVAGPTLRTPAGGAIGR